MENTIENGNMPAQKKVPVMPEKKMKRTRQRLIFYILIMIFPMVHYFVFKLYINIDMFAMAFSEYKLEGILLKQKFVGFKNFTFIWDLFGQTTATNHYAYTVLLRNSFLFYAIGLTFVPVGICFAYYIYKGYPLANTFRVFLYLPQILSAVVLTFLYKEIMIRILEVGTLSLAHIVLYNFWTGFGVNVIMYTGAMCGINTSISESAQLDGASSLRELWSITIPMIFPTIVTFLVMGISGIFTSQANLYSFYGSNLSNYPAAREYQPLGYYMYVNTLLSDIKGTPSSSLVVEFRQLSYPQLSAMGLMITVVVLPVALGLRHVLEKYGPSDK